MTRCLLFRLFRDLEVFWTRVALLQILYLTD